MSRVFRFHQPTSIVSDNSKRVLRKRKSRKLLSPILIAADSCFITDKSGTRPIHSFSCLSGARHITLTRREADYIALANPGIRPPDALENLHPWLPNTPYVSSSKANFRSLNAIVSSYSEHLLTASAFCDVKWNTICNAVRVKTDIDALFYTAWHLPIQDVFVLEEKRPNRSVIAIDFNGMYGACMQQPFPKPSALRLVRFNRNVEPDECLPIGLYRCLLKTPTSDFILKYNPFRSFFSGRHLQAKLSEHVEVDLNEFEVHYFRQHFKQIQLVDAVTCDQSISHPLALDIRRSYARRKHFVAQGNKPLADREKYLSTLMSSCSQRPIRTLHNFRSQSATKQYLCERYGIQPNHDEPEGALQKWLSGRKGISVTDTSKGVSVDVPELQDGSACFLFSQRIVARSRIAMLEMMEKIVGNASEIEICYVNIDSIHVSVPTINLDNILKPLRAEASDNLGSFKIEAVTEHGLWLEPGRYWLYNEAIEKFKNRSIGDRHGPFGDHVSHVASREIEGLHIPIKATVRMERSMSPSRAIVEDIVEGIARQYQIELGEDTSFGHILDQLERNSKQFGPVKMNAFHDLKVRMGFA